MRDVQAAGNLPSRGRHGSLRVAGLNFGMTGDEYIIVFTESSPLPARRVWPSAFLWWLSNGRSRTFFALPKPKRAYNGVAVRLSNDDLATLLLWVK
ncbi:hypothetical protein BKA23_2491 [Rudaeicoccus suwonensis]|uniref:Uncharacterized protein n=2 Tax=Rudaeicoccus suwonensis TaxID=657409 RepID=A0A561E3G3_9MICO|nr:hypothetical protein BKA23_2491 [Rudaeicoccus suwonensis]